jgi:AcrR family transcriptional regulator
MSVLAVDAGSSQLETRIVEASLRCVARWGVAKTTVDDVAREAGLSRATVYRAFPGGKERIAEVLLRHELGRFFQQVGGRLDAAPTLEDLVTGGMTEAIRFVRGHEAMQYLLMRESHLVLPYLALEGMAQLLAAASSFCEPYLARFVPAARAREAGEWLTRMVLSYALSPTPSVDPDDPESIRRLVRTYVLPGLTTTS